MTKLHFFTALLFIAISVAIAIQVTSLHEKNKAKKVVAQAETNVNEKADKTEAEKVPMKAESKLSQLTDKDFNGTGVWRLEDVLPNGEKVFIYICKSDYRTLAATAVKPKEDKSDK